MLLHLVLLAVILLVTVLYIRRRRRRGLGDFPGPRGWPIAGNALQFTLDHAHKAFYTWHEQLGGAFKITLFGKEVLILAGGREIHEALVQRGHDFAGREQPYRGEVAGMNHALALLQPTEAWKQLRKASHKCVKMYDTGMKRIENLSLQVVEEAVEEISKHGGRRFDIKPVIYRAAMNFMTQFLVGKSFSPDHPFSILLMKTETGTRQLFDGSPEGLLLDAVPLSRFLGARRLHQKLLEYRQLVDELTRILHEEIETTEDRDSFVVGALQKLLETSSEVTEEQVKHTNFGHVIAGVITTTSTMYCMINALLHHPDIYRKLQNDIDDVIGDRHVVLEDKSKLPYLSAVISETLRYASISPIFPRRTTTDTHISGKFVPNDTMVLVNPWSVHHDPDIYPEPWRFTPERFLAADGSLVLADHPARRNLYAFGAGSRGCFGEILAKTRIFLMTATLMKHFEFKFGDQVSSGDPREYKAGLPMICHDYTLEATPRSE